MDDAAASVSLTVVLAVEPSAEVVTRHTFDDVVLLYRLPMLRLAQFLLGAHGSPEDIVHDALLKTYLRFERVDNPHAYLRQCVVNGCRSEHRRRAVLERITPKLEIRGPNPETPDFLLDAIQRLPYRQRAAVLLRYFEDLSHDDIAKTLRCTTKAAESLVRNGVQSLRRSLGD